MQQTSSHEFFKNLSKFGPFLIGLIGIACVILEPLFIYEFQVGINWASFVNPLNLWSRRFEDLHSLAQFFHFIFFFLLLIGGLRYNLFKKSAGLVRFVLSIILINNALDLVSSLVSTLSQLDEINKGYIKIHWPLTFGHLFFKVIWTLVSYKIIQFISSTKQAMYTVYDTNEEEIAVHSYVQKSNGARFTHMMFDPIVYLLIMTKYAVTVLFLLGGPYYNSRIFLYLVSFIFYIIYYALSEYLFRASPVKFLTQSVVTDTNGNRPSFGRVILRTLIRFVPFEAFSFLAHRNWHDSWSETWVIEEVDKD